ncbi:hypothetical protein ACFLZI_01275 [Nitrospirota bacterium]
MKHTRILILIVVLFLSSFSDAEMIDRIVAYVGDEAITSSELMAEHETHKGRGITLEQTLNGIINRRLLLVEARRLRLGDMGDDTLINEYINQRIRTFIVISEEQITRYYKNNRKKFRRAPLNQVRGNIVIFLTEAEVNVRLEHHLDTLRKGAEIGIFLNNGSEGKQ